MAGLGLDKDFLNVSIVNTNENFFIRGDTGTANQVISYDADRRIQFTDIPNDLDNLSVSNPITKNIVGTTHTIGLGFNTNDFQLDGSNNLELKEDFVKTASNPLSVSTQNVSLNFNTNDFQLDGSNNLELKNDPVLTASDPLSISTGNMSLTLDSSKLEVSSGELTLKEDYVKTASSPLSISTGNISISLSTLSQGSNIQTFSYNGTSAKTINLNNALTGITSITGDSYGGIEIKIGSTTHFKIDGSGNVFMPNLPTSDPSNANEIYVSSGFLKISSGGGPPPM